MSTVRITLYSRPDCHLCETMRDIVVPLAHEMGASFDEVDVDEDPAIAARYDLEVPVLCVNGEKAFSIRVGAAELRRHLQKVARSA